MNIDTVLPIARHILQLVAGGFVAKGVIDESIATTAVAGLVSIITVVWWFITKQKPTTPV